MNAAASSLHTLSQNPDFLGAVACGVIGLMGALIGGLISYFGVIRQYRLASREKTADFLAAVLLEICQNHSAHLRDLDRAIPDWLARTDLFEKPAYDAHILRLVASRAKSKTNVYDRLFVELMATEFGLELQTYYDRVATLNFWSDHIEAFVVRRDFDTYIRFMSFSIELGASLFEDIVAHAGSQLKNRKGRGGGLFKDMVEDRERDLFWAALWRTNLRDLEALSADGARPRSLQYTKALATAKPGAFESYIAAARQAAREPDRF